FACPNCAASQSILHEIMQRHPDMNLVFHHLPLVNEHPNALIAARAAQAAGQQHKFWEMHDGLFANRDEWVEAKDPEPTLTALAGAIGLDTRRFAADLHKSEEIDDALAIDGQKAQTCSVHITPSFFLITPTRIWATVGGVGLQ